MKNKNWIWINGTKYELSDIWPINVQRIFTNNHFYNSNNSHGGNAIRLGSDIEKFLKFFELNVDINTLSQEDYSEEKNFILLKKDLDKYLSDVKDKFENPPEDYIYFDENVNQEKYEITKIKIHEDFKNLINEYKHITESFFEFKMLCKKDNSQNNHLLPIKEDVEKFFGLLRKMVIPEHTNFCFLKLKKNKKTIFYLKLSSTSANYYERSNLGFDDLKINFSTIKQLWASLNAGQNVILTGIPGTGKTHLATISAKEVMGEKGYLLTTATSDWTTFDTIGGLIPKDDGQLVFREGKFLQAIKENKWLIIDEINRADIDKAFGHLFTALSGQDVELPYYIKNESNELNPIKIKSCDKFDSFYDDETATYFIGKNWRIIGTMNSYDKNALFDLSYAFMRRFMIIEVGVPENFSEFIVKLKNEDDEIIYDKFCEKFRSKLEKLYSININSNNIDRKIGPAIFLDILKYLYFRMDLEEDKMLDENKKYKYDNQIFSEALIAYIIPQLEGLNHPQKKDVEYFLKKNVFEEDDAQLVIDKLNDIKSYFN